METLFSILTWMAGVVVAIAAIIVFTLAAIYINGLYRNKKTADTSSSDDGFWKNIFIMFIGGGF